MEKRLRRYGLPNYVKLDLKFDIKKLQEAFKLIPNDEINTDDLTGKDSYGDLVGGRSNILQKTFGLEFSSFEDAYKFLQENDVDESELRKGLPGERRMCWDFRNYVKPFENYICQTDSGMYKVNGSPYKQIALTEFNPKEVNRCYRVKIPKTRLDERHYNKIKNWVQGTYYEEVLSSFQGEVHRARIAIMEPGAFVAEHIDYNTDYSVRYHIPIETNDQCGFYILAKGKEKDYKFMPADGSVWFINQGLRHSAWNKGSTRRAHLILSVNGQEDIQGLHDII